MKIKVNVSFTSTGKEKLTTKTESEIEMASLISSVTTLADLFKRGHRNAHQNNLSDGEPWKDGETPKLT